MIDAGVEVARRVRRRPRAGGAVHGRPRPRGVHVPLTIGGEPWPGVQVWTDHPAIACMASQYAGWAITPDGYFAMGSGPLRAKARVEHELFDKLGYAERRDARRARARRPHAADRRCRRVGRATRPASSRRRPDVRRRPDREHRRRRADRRARHRDRPAQDGDARLRRQPRGAARWAPRRCRRRREERHCAPSAAPTTASCTAARPATPSVRTTTSWHGSPSGCRRPASSDYGTPFYDIFKRYDSDFYKIDPLLFSPAEVWLTSATSGRTFHGGRLNPRRAARVAVRGMRPRAVVILSARTGWHTDELCRALAARGHAGTRRCRTRRCVARAGRRARRGRRSRATARRLLNADAVLARIIPNGSLEQIIYRVDALHWLEDRGVPVMNSPRAIERCGRQVLHDGAAAGSRAADAGDGRVRAPGRRDGRRVRAMGDVIVKPHLRLDGPRAGPRQRSRRRRFACSVRSSSMRAVFYVQRAVDHGGRDVRAFVVGGRVVGAIERAAPDGDWRTNVSRGGSATPFALPAEWERLALRAAAAVGARLRRRGPAAVARRLGVRARSQRHSWLAGAATRHGARRRGGDRRPTSNAR